MTLSLTNSISALLTIGARLSGMVLLAPFFGNTAIPRPVKACLVLGLTVILYPLYGPKIAIADMHQWPMVALTELAIGAAVGITANLVFEGVQLAGQALSVQMGYSLINILDPQTQVESTVVAVFHQTIAMLIFLRLDVHHLIIRAVSNSFEYLPPGSGHMKAAVVVGVFQIGARIIAVGTQIAAPVLSATLVADIVIGALGKAATQIPLMLLGPALKSILGLAIMVAFLGYWPTIFGHLFVESISYSEQLLHLAR